MQNIHILNIQVHNEIRHLHLAQGSTQPFTNALIYKNGNALQRLHFLIDRTLCCCVLFTYSIHQFTIVLYILLLFFFLFYKNKCNLLYLKIVHKIRIQQCNDYGGLFMRIAAHRHYGAASLHIAEKVLCNAKYNVESNVL